MTTNTCRSDFTFGWLLMWSGLVLVADAVALWTTYHQTRASRFPTTDGVITRSAVKTDRDKDGVYRLDVAYEYEVGGRRYTGTRYSYTEIGTNTEAWDRIRDQLPVGTRVSVAYDPDAPAESLLRPGFTGFHLTLVWFLTPFNVIGIVGWVVRARRGGDSADPRGAMRTATGWRVRLTDSGRIGCFAVAFLGITFCGTFVWALGFGFNPPVWAAGWGYVVAVVVAGVVSSWSALPWLEVDEVARVVRLPAPSLEIPFAVIHDVIVTHEEKIDSDGDMSYKYHCELVRSDAAPDEPPVRVTTYQQRSGAEALAAWLRERIMLTAPGAGNADRASGSAL